MKSPVAAVRKSKLRLFIPPLCDQHGSRVPFFLGAHRSRRKSANWLRFAKRASEFVITAFPASKLALSTAALLSSILEKSLLLAKRLTRSGKLAGCTMLALSLFRCSLLDAAELSLHGRVVDENDAPVRDAHVTIRLTTSSPIWAAQTDPTGAFSLTLPKPGDYLVSVDREGYYALTNQTVRAEMSTPLTFVINTVREVFQSENVNAQASPVDVAETQNEEHLSGTEVNDIPYANSHSLRNSLELLPGVIQDNSGTLHVNGSAENQVLYLFNGFNITNPISGQFQTILAVEGIRSVDLSSGQSSPEFGKGSAGVMRVNTEGGTDRFHYTATDFIPGVNIQQGVRLGNWYPRVGFSGPIIRGKAWFADTLESELTNSVVTGLPGGKNTRGGWAGSNALHGQVNLTPSNILFADFLVNVNNQNNVGLGPLNPETTTTTVDTRQYFASIKDQQYFGHGMLLEFGYGHDHYSARQTPQGQNLYLLSPEGNSGNYFVNSSQTATRDEALIHAFLPKFQFAGSHQFELGTDSDWLRYNGDFRRTGYQVLGVSGQLLSATTFPAPAKFAISDSEISAYFLDTWRVLKTLQVTAGARGDRDRYLSATAWSPRAAFSWSPLEGTRVSGGYSITHDAVTMQILGLPLDQTAVTTTYNANGDPTGPPTLATFQITRNGLALPRATNWTLTADRQLWARVFLAAKYLRRRGTNGFTFLNTLNPDAPPSLLPYPNPQSAALYQLTNLRRDDFDSFAISVRQTLSGQFEWMASYTRSRAITNSVIDPSVPETLQVLSSLVPMPWNAPNRLVARSYLPLPWKNWAVSAFVDARSGFPFSVRDQTGVIVGPVDSHRFPVNFDLNLAVERMLTVRGRRFALRGGMDNVTNQGNPSSVNNVTGTPQFLQFTGDEGRHFVVRIRFFGRSK